MGVDEGRAGPRSGALRGLRAVAGPPFLLISFVARLPVAMNVIGVLTMLTLIRGSVAEAGIASAVLGVSSGFAGPLWGAVVDRRGQRTVLTVVGVIHALALVGVVLVASLPTPGALVVIACLVAGVTTAPIAPLTRARWIAMFSDPSDPRRQERIIDAMSYEGIADELSFASGPVLVGLLTVTLDE